MERDFARISVFVASPSDVSEERDRLPAVVEELNLTLERVERNVMIKLRRWETDAWPGFGVDAQDVINEQLEPYDIFLGILGRKIGQPTARAESGTVEEFNRAFEAWEVERRPSIMFYFKDAHVPLTLQAWEELGPVLRFRESLKSKGLLGEYVDVDDFERKVRQHLFAEISRLIRREEGRQARQDSPPEEEGTAGDDETGRVSADLLDLRLRLEAKMTWLCKHLLAGPDTPSYATVGSLHTDGYLTREQARVAARILTADPEALAYHRPDDLARFLADAEAVVSTFRVIVFDAYVRDALRRAGWALRDDFEQSSGHRPDFIAARDDHVYRMAARVVTSPDSKVRERTVMRLKRAREGPPAVERRMIVIPDKSTAPTDGPDADPQVIRLAELLKR